MAGTASNINVLFGDGVHLFGTFGVFFLPWAASDDSKGGLLPQVGVFEGYFIFDPKLSMLSTGESFLRAPGSHFQQFGFFFGDLGRLRRLQRAPFGPARGL